MSKWFEYKERKPVITILRLRNSQKYTGKNLLHTMDSFYYLLSKFIDNNPQYDYRFYNLSIKNIKKKARSITDIIDSDILIIPTEMEFVFHLDSAPFFIKNQSDKWLIEVNKALNDGKKRKGIILSSDKYDTIECISKTITSANIQWNRIDENDFIGGIHHLKHLFITEETFNKEKDTDFCYWGSMHKKDDRKEIMKWIKKNNELSKILIGWYDKGIKPYKDGMLHCLEDIGRSRATLCFNTQPKGFTSRYGEALACGSIPLVWKDYDKENEIVAIEWQRCWNLEELKDKLIQLRDASFFQQTYNTIHKNYISKTKAIDYYEDVFNYKLKSCGF